MTTETPDTAVVHE